MSLRIDFIPNRGRAPQILLRRSWREGKRVRHKTVANLSGFPASVVEGFRAVLRGGAVFASLADAVSIRRSLPHGHVAAALGTARKLGLPRIFDRRGGRPAALALAAVVARLAAPASKLATARQLSPETASSSLGALLGLGPVRGNEMLDMLDWLRRRQPWIERSLARRHLQGAALVLYDVSSSYLEGRRCPLADFGRNRDGKKGKRQITCGLLCASDGCPVAVEVFAGSTADPATVASQVEKVRERFRIDRVALVGDRGMLTAARIRENLAPVGLDWISALKTADIRKLLARAGEKDGKPAGEDAGEAPLRPEALPPDAVAEIASPDFPGERLLACLDPRLREERARKREDLLRATEDELRAIAATAARAKPGPKNRDAIHKALGERAGRWKMRKHFDIEAREDGLAWERNRERIAAEARLDGIYVIRTSLGAEALGADRAVEAYKSLSRVERAFRTIKTARLEVRPIHACNEDRVRAHVFLCVLAYYLEWHMRRALAPLLFEDADRAGAAAQRGTPVEKAEVSDSAQAKAASKATPEGLPVHGFDTLLQDLATLTLNDVTLPGQPDTPFRLLAEPTELQRKAFDLLGFKPDVYSQPPG